MRTLAALVLAVALVVLAAGCGGGGGSGDAQERATIEHNWETFFDGSGAASPATRAGLCRTARSSRPSSGRSPPTRSRSSSPRR
jgi:hypothetical protein